MTAERADKIMDTKIIFPWVQKTRITASSLVAAVYDCRGLPRPLATFWQNHFLEKSARCASCSGPLSVYNAVDSAVTDSCYSSAPFSILSYIYKRSWLLERDTATEYGP